MEGITRYYRSVKQSIPKYNGLAAPLWRFYSHLDRQFDRRHGVDTCSTIPLRELTVQAQDFDAGRDSRQYEPASTATFRKLMALLPRELGDYVFVDYGSGKGRALLLASHYGFRRIIGIEFAEELNLIAARNLARYRARGRKCHDVEVITGDARGYRPPGSPAVYFFYNPFPAPVLTRVIDNIRHTHQCSAQPFYVIYLNPRCSSLFERQPFLRTLAHRRFALREAAVYQSLPLAGPGAGH